ncbi:NAD(P)/FAD-dependent oxidoreductase [Rhizobium leguminosarum]|uniref:NAD(P)/FAD-dependent oxidoreductase n=1 Tax=Rhizobium leguminosarum TaxID=384 RepID=UPI001C965433|nr:NAD(P)/FAD-dependent oxidoreductase [Rhizobium leguminosarum]MBY5333397.1 NAD(P)/FAD-dependent oxidoreductase [Rhizobium leguminosarum]MBY5346487.1 NAD(P)/FAD-dependent oxidoreductase [Rhizobium leguminosarum]MBY5407378.1 NAD(P)/FAD-dependent oxidoreductase [Rhizobium leguminosarum]
MSDHHVVVVGGGFGGLQLVNGLKDAGVRITLVDRRNHHLFQPLLYQVATTILSTSEIAWPIRRLYADRPDVTVLLGEVTGVDSGAKTVSLRNGMTLSYDTLVLATGATHAYFGHDEWEPVAPGLKTLEDATTIRRRLLLAFEKAEMESDPAVRDALLTFTIVGAGPTGVELAGIIAELAHFTLPKEFRNIDTRKTRVVLVEAGPRVLPTFAEELSAYAQKALEKLGVEIHLGKPVTECNADGVKIGETFVASRTIVWAAGVTASPAARWLGVAADRAGRVVVEKDLSAPGLPDVFVVGDTASVMREDGKPVPGIAPAAKQQGGYVAKVIRARISGKPAPAPFRYWHQGSLATIGKSAAIIDFGRIKLKGWLAWWIWGLAHIYFLIGTRSRFSVAWSWLWIYLSGQHSARLITQRETMREEG